MRESVGVNDSCAVTLKRDGKILDERNIGQNKLEEILKLWIKRISDSRTKVQ